MLSVPHLIIIFIVALVVFGPEKLPELARNFGKVMAEFKRATGDLRSTFEEHLREIERETDQRRIGGATVAAAPAQAAAIASSPAFEKTVDLAPVEQIPGVVPAKPPYDPPADLSDYDESETYMYKPSAPHPGEDALDLEVEAEAPAEPVPAATEEHSSKETPTEAVSTDGGTRPD